MKNKKEHQVQMDDWGVPACMETSIYTKFSEITLIWRQNGANTNMNKHLWRFPEVSPNHQFYFRIVPYKPSILGYPHIHPYNPYTIIAQLWIVQRPGECLIPFFFPLGQPPDGSKSSQQGSIQLPYTGFLLFITTGWWLTDPPETYLVSWDDELPNIWKNMEK